MLKKIDIHLTDHCNLNCKGCTHFSPLAEEFYINVDDFEADLKRMSYLTGGQIEEIYLLGGEPLLHPEITEFFPIARNLFRNSKIIVISNGILLPKMEDKFFKALRRSDVQLWISDYCLNMDYGAIQKKCKDFNVTLMYTSYTKDKDGNKLWTKFTLDPEGKQNWVNAFEACCIKNCVTLKKGKLYTCPTIAHIEHFNKHFKTNLEVSEYDYIDIYKINSHQGLLDAMVKPTAFCRYCKTNAHEQCFWGPTKKDIKEWT